MVGSMQTPIIPIGSGQTQELIAPVQDTLIAKQNYAQGQQFILGGVLFTVTKSGGISVGDTINMNTDVEASDNITDQLKGSDWVEITAETNQYYELQQAMYLRSKYIIKNGICYGMFAVKCITVNNSSVAIGRVPAVANAIDGTMPVAMQCYGSSAADTLKCLIQNGLIYVRYGQAGFIYLGLLCYPVQE